MAPSHHNSRQRAAESGARRSARIALVAALLAVGFSVLPAPAVTWIDNLRVDRETLTFEPASVEAPAQSAAALDPHESHDADSSVVDGSDDGRVVSEAVDVEEFVSIGVSLSAPPTDHVLIRWSQEGEWSVWSELELGLDEGPDLGSVEAVAAEAESVDGAVVSQPVWVGDASGYQISLAATDAAAQESTDGAEAILVREDGRSMVLDTEELEAGASSAGATVHLRSEWSARAPKDSMGSATLKMAVIHHTASGNDYSRADVPAVIRSIQTYHMDSNGWSDIGYNFIVDKYGEIWEGRYRSATQNTPGAHASGFNTGTVGIAALGHYSLAAPTTAQITSISELIAKSFAENGVDPTTNVNFTSGGGPKYSAGTVVNLNRIIGHTDVGATSCPGSRLYPSVSGSVRAKVKSAIGKYTSPIGDLDGAVPGFGSITVSGWAIDPDAPSGISIHVYVDGKGFNIGVADRWRTDLVASRGSEDANHGFSAELNGMTPGTKSVCTFAINVGNGSNVNLGCRKVTVPGGKPIGHTDVAVAAPNGFVAAAGWSIDPDTARSNRVHIYLDREGVSTAADTTRVDVGGAFPLHGSDHGFSWATGGVAPGRYSLCAYGIDLGNDGASNLGCRSVTVPGGKPIGRVDLLSASGGKVSIAGWAIDPDVTTPVAVHIYIDGVGYNTGGASGLRPDVGAAYEGYGDAHGLSWQSPSLSRGTHRVCVYAMNKGVGSTTSLGCRTVVT